MEGDAIVTLASVLAAWRNPKTWGPPGKGCCWCTDGEPAEHGVCIDCWISIWHREWIWIKGWIARQDIAYERQEERRAALELWHKFTLPTGIYKYAEKYGVWLVPEATITWLLHMINGH